MKLTYWIAKQDKDHSCYDLRARTRKECNEMIAKAGQREGYYAAPIKVVVEYANAFDLMDQCMSEGGLYEYAE